MCILDGCAVADTSTGAFSGGREQNLKTPPTLHSMLINEQHILINDLH